jgi:hypothetical protein
VVTQRFESFPERERPQRCLAPATSFRRKVAMKNKRERENERAKTAMRQGGGGGDWLWHGAREGDVGDSGLRCGAW